MTLKDWIDYSIELYRTKPPLQATRESAYKFRMGAQRRIAPRVGTSIWESDEWDVVVVMDACRYDLWSEVAPEYDEFADVDVEQSIYSVASCSIDWIERTFNEHPEEAAHTGYITANPFTDHNSETSRSADLLDGPVQYCKPLYKTHWKDLHGGLLPEEEKPDVGDIATVPPEDVTDHAIAAWRRRDELGIDRLVVHYMQPHEPYRSRPKWGSGDHKLLENMVTDGEKKAGSSIWPALKDGEVPMDEFWEVYQDNLRWVLDDVTDRLFGNIDGTVMFTADHGNALGEWGEWHHPGGALSPAVRKVPWVAVESLDEKTVTPDCVSRISQADSPAWEGEDSDATSVDEQLEALGYK